MVVFEQDLRSELENLIQINREIREQRMERDGAKTDADTKS